MSRRLSVFFAAKLSGDEDNSQLRGKHKQSSGNSPYRFQSHLGENPGESFSALTDFPSPPLSSALGSLDPLSATATDSLATKSPEKLLRYLHKASDSSLVRLGSFT